MVCFTKLLCFLLLIPLIGSLTEKDVPETLAGKKLISDVKIEPLSENAFLIDGKFKITITPDFIEVQKYQQIVCSKFFFFFDQPNICIWAIFMESSTLFFTFLFGIYFAKWSEDCSTDFKIYRTIVFTSYVILYFVILCLSSTYLPHQTEPLFYGYLGSTFAITSILGFCFKFWSTTVQWNQFYIVGVIFFLVNIAVLLYLNFEATFICNDCESEWRDKISVIGSFIGFSIGWQASITKWFGLQGDRVFIRYTWHEVAAIIGIPFADRLVTKNGVVNRRTRFAITPISGATNWDVAMRNPDRSIADLPQQQPDQPEAIPVTSAYNWDVTRKQDSALRSRRSNPTRHESPTAQSRV